MEKKEEFNLGKFISEINEKNKIERIFIFICGVFIYALSFTIFFSPYNIVTGGTTGLSLIVRSIFNIDNSKFVFIFSALLLILGRLLLGRKTFIRTCFGVFMLPIFMKASEIFVPLLSLKDASLFLMVFFGGIFMGLGNGMIIHSGFSVGGFQTFYQILYKYFAISIGKSTLLLNGILICCGGFYFGITNAMYAIIGLYISSVVTDKVMLETSLTKTFFIVTDKDQEIREYIHEVMGYGITVIDAKGNNLNTKKVLMCCVPTRNYCNMKEIINKIDKDVFFLITDTYEIYDGM